VINDRAIKFDVNGPIPHYQWYISDSLGERIMQCEYHKVKLMTRLDLFLLMYPPAHLVKVIALTNHNLRKIGKEEVQKGELIKFFESSFLEHGLNFSVGVIYGPQNQCPDLLKLPSLVRR